MMSDWGAPEPVKPYRDNTQELEDVARKHLEGYGQRMPALWQLVGGLWMLRIPTAVVLFLWIAWKMFEFAATH